MILEEEGKPIELKHGNYYHILHKNTNSVLSLPPGQTAPLLEHFAKDRLEQVWMIEEMQSFRYEIVHALSSEVLNANKKQCWLEPGKQRAHQLFFMQKSNPKQCPNDYWIRCNRTSPLRLARSPQLRMEPESEEGGDEWRLVLVDPSN